VVRLKQKFTEDGGIEEMLIGHAFGTVADYKKKCFRAGFSEKLCAI